LNRPNTPSGSAFPIPHGVAKNVHPEPNLPEETSADSSGHLARQTVSGLGWSLGAQLLRQGSQFLITVLLARLLMPREFGLVAMVVVFSGFASLFSDLGFGPALVQRQDIEQRHYCSVFWLNVVFGIVLAGILAGASPLIAKFYREPRLIPIVLLVGLCFPINSLGLVQKASLTRQMDFRALGLIDIGNVTISGIIAIVLAWRGLGVWSLVCQMLCMTIFEVVGLWWFSSWRPRVSFDRTAIRELLGFSSHLTGFTAINYWYRNGDNLLVGKFFGSAALGIYSRAYNLMLLPLTQVTYVVSKVMFPALSRLQDDKARVRSIYLRSIAMIALITFPLMLGLLVVADHFILAIYGNAWAGVIPILRVFCVLGMVQSISSTAGWIFQSQGRTDWMFWWGIICALLSIGVMMLGVRLGSAMAVAACLTAIGILLTPPAFSISGKLIDMTLRDVAQSTWSVLACAAAMACSVWALGAFLPSSWSHWAYLSIEVPFGMAAYALLIHVFQLTPYRECRTMLLQQLKPETHPSIPSAVLRDSCIRCKISNGP
jgi:O-antigen/teichoic acid export membrane protein